MSRRGNCWDRAIVRHWFKPNGEGCGGKRLQPAQTRTHPPQEIQNREEARRDVFALRGLQAIAYRPVDYIGFFYNPQRKHGRHGMLSPTAFEQQQKLKLQGV